MIYLPSAPFYDLLYLVIILTALNFSSHLNSVLFQVVCSAACASAPRMRRARMQAMRC